MNGTTKWICLLLTGSAEAPRISLGFGLNTVKVSLTLQQKGIVCSLHLMKLFDAAFELLQIVQVKLRSSCMITQQQPPLYMLQDGLFNMQVGRARF